jgi:hypothetical protein
MKLTLCDGNGCNNTRRDDIDPERYWMKVTLQLDAPGSQPQEQHLCSECIEKIQRLFGPAKVMPQFRLATTPEGQTFTCPSCGCSNLQNGVPCRSCGSRISIGTEAMRTLVTKTALKNPPSETNILKNYTHCECGSAFQWTPEDPVACPHCFRFRCPCGKTYQSGTHGSCECGRPICVGPWTKTGGDAV